MKKGSNRDSSRIGSQQPVLCSTSKWKSLLISVVTACIAPRHLKRKPKAEPKHQRCFWEKNRDAEPQNLPLTLLLWPCSARFHHSRALFVKQKIRTLFGCSCALLFGPSVLSIPRDSLRQKFLPQIKKGAFLDLRHFFLICGVFLELRQNLFSVFSTP